jgi:NADPH:quinone reductase-like Zn-dependent oxidoreductase
MHVVTTGNEVSLEEIAQPKPVPGPGQVLLEIKAAGVTPTELGWYPTTHTKDGSARTGAIPGHEFSGVIAGVGASVQAFKLGDAVYGMNDWFEDGAAAEFCLSPVKEIALKPASLTHEEAATVPIAALTAWQGLLLHGRLQAGETVLVHGGSGSVGAFAVQIAALHGARVITTASRASFGYVKGLGASDCIDYVHESFETRVTDVDIVFDTVGGSTLARSFSVIGKGGRVVTIASDAESSNDPRVKEAFFIVEPDGRQLETISALFDEGRLHTSVKAILPLMEAARAYTQSVSGGFGKVVLRPA